MTFMTWDFLSSWNLIGNWSSPLLLDSFEKSHPLTAVGKGKENQTFFQKFPSLHAWTVVCRVFESIDDCSVSGWQLDNRLWLSLAVITGFFFTVTLLHHCLRCLSLKSILQTKSFWFYVSFITAQVWKILILLSF